jgi:putative thiamine transport system permease protein
VAKALRTVITATVSAALTPGEGPLRTVLQFFPWLTASLFILPVLLGLLGTWLPAFGYLPSVGADSFSLQPWRDLLNYPGIGKALGISLLTSWGAMLLSLLISCVLLAACWQSRVLRWLQRSLPLLLAVPHAAFAIGVVALLAPSGWLLRLLSPWATGLDAPPFFSLMNDPNGFGLLLVLTLKELPFVLFMSFIALGQLQVERTLYVCRSLGYADTSSWWRVLIPQLLPRLRLPLFAVLAYGLSVVDVALIAGPNTPPAFAVMIDRMFNHPDIVTRLTGSAAATFLLLLTVGSLSLWFFAERLYLRWISAGACKGHRGLRDGRLASVLRVSTAPEAAGQLIAVTMLMITVAAFVLLVLWSVSFRWSFPDALPQSYSLQFWQRGWQQLRLPIWYTMSTGIASAVIGLLLVVACLEHEVTHRRRDARDTSMRLFWLIYIPLITPQIAFLFGVQTVLLQLNAWGNWWSLVWIHLVFVIPYLFLSLSGPYRNFDDRYLQQAANLCGSEWRALWRVKWPMLLRPLLAVTALGFAVSVSQYLATLYIGAGRLPSVTTETVAIATGGDRRLVAVLALFQWLLPLIMYSLALLIPWYVFRHRKAMQVG